MPWDTIFAVANGWALLLWLILIALPRTTLSQTFVFYTGVGLLCCAYVLLFGLLLSGAVDPVRVGEAGEASFTSIAGVRSLFASDAGVTIGWIHYLAFDLFVGAWIARRACSSSSFWVVTGGSTAHSSERLPTWCSSTRCPRPTRPPGNWDWA